MKDHLIANLAELQKVFTNEDLKTSGLKNAEPVRLEMGSRAPVGVTRQYRETMVKEVVAESPGTVVIEVGPSYKSSVAKGRGRLAHLLEYGHRITTRGKKKDRRDTGKRVAPRPHLRPAWESKKDEVMRGIESDARAQLASLGK